ncbi:helix-turn-helix transcriptional regulator [Shimia sp.]|uniref:helix-turn-helix transcriptional regulator n=1 Tax=Shimia sp. TaxID=1954381 RepID=UPI003BAB6556
MSQRKKTVSREAKEAIELLGLMIRSARLERNMTTNDLASRAGVSRPLLARVENGDSKVGIGSVFEIAAVVGVPLLGDQPNDVSNALSAERRYQSVLRQRAFQAQNRKVDDDF